MGPRGVVLPLVISLCLAMKWLFTARYLSSQHRFICPLPNKDLTILSLPLYFVYFVSTVSVVILKIRS